MRLIDADEFRDDIFRQSEFIKVDDFQVLPVVDVAECLDNAPTVMAIPIEWIKKKSLEFLMNRNFRWATDFQEVIDLWKVENNIPLFDDDYKPMPNREKENQSLE